MKKPSKVSVTGASGQIGYAILFRILNGEVFGENVKIDLQLIDINVDKIQRALYGVALELEDCAFPVKQFNFTLGPKHWFYRYRVLFFNRSKA